MRSRHGDVIGTIALTLVAGMRQTESGLSKQRLETRLLRDHPWDGITKDGDSNLSRFSVCL